VSADRAALVERDRCEARIVHFERVHRAREEAISDHELDRLALTYKVLGDATRLKILMALGAEEMCVCDLAAFLGVSESGVSHQLRRLKDLALIKQRRQGQILYKSLNDDHVADLVRVGLEHVRE
jgi:DNA-binding transcriptional ArsR family regulator